MKTGNLFQHIPAHLPDEISQRLAGGSACRIERIVSKGHASPPGFWYEQQQNEWVLQAKGAARLRFESEIRLIDLAQGMYLDIPARMRHRVDRTCSERETIWLAVFYCPGAICLRGLSGLSVSRHCGIIRPSCDEAHALHRDRHLLFCAPPTRPPISANRHPACASGCTPSFLNPTPAPGAHSTWH